MVAVIFMPRGLVGYAAPRPAALARPAAGAMSTAARPSRGAPPATDAILSVRGLTVRFGALVAVDDVSFDARRGHITSIIGPNGAGKSTLFNLISGAIRPSAGRVLFEGRDMTGAPPYRMLAAGLARSFQITNLFFELPVRENLRLAAQFLERGGRPAAPGSCQPRGGRAGRRAAGVVRPHRQGPGDWPATSRMASSAGSRSRCRIASRPAMLLLDEPTQGMSHADTAETETMIRGLAATTSPSCSSSTTSTSS